MSRGRRYASVDQYAQKMHRVMERFGAELVGWNHDRHGAWIQFRYRDELYQFDHSVAKAQERGVNIRYGSDAFCQLVLSLEDLARMVERGIYDLSTWVSGMKMLPPVVEVPSFFKQLGFTELPSSTEDVRACYRSLAKELHPDAGGNEDDFRAIKQAAEQAVQWFATTGQDGNQ